MTHKCKCQCEHENVKYCPDCGKVYCQDCPETWERPMAVYPMPYVIPQEPYQPNDPYIYRWYDGTGTDSPPIGDSCTVTSPEIDFCESCGTALGVE